MTYQEMIKAIKAAKVIYCYVRFTTNDGHSVLISKAQALAITNAMNHGDEYEAVYYDSRRSLHIG